MRIALDLDGVLYEWDKTARYMMREYRDFSRSGPMGMESTSWDYIEQHVGTENWKWLWKEGIELGLFRYGHVVTGAQSGVRKLRQAGHAVYVVTHRPAAAVPDTIAWLDLFQKERAGVVFDGVHILSNGERKSTVSADILVDDKPSNLEDWIGHGRRGILFDREWNQGAKPAGSFRGYDWGDVVKLVEGLNANDQGRKLDGSRVGEPNRGTEGTPGNLLQHADDPHGRRPEEAGSRA